MKENLEWYKKLVGEGLIRILPVLVAWVVFIIGCGYVVMEFFVHPVWAVVLAISLVVLVFVPAALWYLRDL